MPSTMAQVLMFSQSLMAAKKLNTCETASALGVEQRAPEKIQNDTLVTEALMAAK